MSPSPHACANVREAGILIIGDDPVVVAAYSLSRTAHRMSASSGSPFRDGLEFAFAAAQGATRANDLAGMH